MSTADLISLQSHCSPTTFWLLPYLHGRALDRSSAVPCSGALPAMCDLADQALDSSPCCHLSVQPQLKGLLFFPKDSVPGPLTLALIFSLCTHFLETAPMLMASLTWRKRSPTFPLNSGPTSPMLQARCLLLPPHDFSSFSDPP